MAERYVIMQRDRTTVRYFTNNLKYHWTKDLAEATKFSDREVAQRVAFEFECIIAQV